MIKKITERIAWLLPKTLCYWVFLRVLGDVSIKHYPKKPISRIGCMEALGRWVDDNRLNHKV